MLDPVLMKIKGDIGGKKVMVFEICGDGTLWYLERLCVPNVDSLQKRFWLRHMSHTMLFIPVLQRCIMISRRCIGGTV